MADQTPYGMPSYNDAYMARLYHIFQDRTLHLDMVSFNVKGFIDTTWGRGTSICSQISLSDSFSSKCTLFISATDSVTLVTTAGHHGKTLSCTNCSMSRLDELTRNKEFMVTTATFDLWSFETWGTFTFMTCPFTSMATRKNLITDFVTSWDWIRTICSGIGGIDVSLTTMTRSDEIGT
ncbi:hypothetical protein WICPIJ_003189 [Wickerhamomyces pijperi]|uniref:Uncharacterized protein n=1 Tax=Wickerhamomyces pijperi TaxID=599730 RepID=A0A9P8QA15_WICPI|nr:hypothetical protein WICPIJ_003189 [Wickerhamomyces pijperi]